MAIGKWLAGVAGGAGPREAEAVLGPFRKGHSLTRGQGWRSDNGRVELRLDDTGKLVLRLDGKVAWTPVAADGATKLQMNAEGQLVLSRGAERLWGVGLAKCPRAELRVQDDGNAVLYYGNSVLWASHTKL